MSDWVQRRFKLHNQNVYLLNGSTFRYGMLKIPCCQSCNTIHLNKIETAVSEAIATGADAVRALPPLSLYVWLGKTFYGLLYKELFLRRDLRSPSKTPILSRRALKELAVLHYCLQAARVPFEVHAPPPVRFPLGSLFVYDLQEPSPLEARFDLRDSYFGLAISLALGKVGMIACFGDGGSIRERFDDIHERLVTESLHPLQFGEVTANVFYSALLLERTPKFVFTTLEDRISVVGMPLQGLSSKPAFAPWVNTDYLGVLAACVRLPVDQLGSPDGSLRMSWLFDGDGRFTPIRDPSA